MHHFAIDPNHCYTLEEYFDLERAHDARFEYWNGEVFDASGGTARHASLSSEILFSLMNATRPQRKNLHVFSCGLPVKTDSVVPYKYPDASVVLGDVHSEIIGPNEPITNPTVLIEVVSPFSEHRDRIEKPAAYRKLSSVKEILVLEHDQPGATLLRRTESGWSKHLFEGGNTRIPLASISLELDLGKLYREVLPLTTNH